MKRDRRQQYRPVLNGTSGQPISEWSLALGGKDPAETAATGRTEESELAATPMPADFRTSSPPAGPAPRPPRRPRPFRRSRPPPHRARPFRQPSFRGPVFFLQPRPCLRTCGPLYRVCSRLASFCQVPRCRSRRPRALSAMGVPKRKVSGAQDSAASAAGAAKRARTEELTGVRFKAQLRDPQGAGPGECWAGPGQGARACRRPLGLGLGGVSVFQIQLLLSAAFQSPRARASPPDVRTGNRDSCDWAS